MKCWLLLLTPHLSHFDIIWQTYKLNFYNLLMKVFYYHQLEYEFYFQIGLSIILYRTILNMDAVKLKALLNASLDWIVMFLLINHNLSLKHFGTIHVLVLSLFLIKYLTFIFQSLFLMILCHLKLVDLSMWVLSIFDSVLSYLEIVACLSLFNQSGNQNSIHQQPWNIFLILIIFKALYTIL